MTAALAIEAVAWDTRRTMPLSVRIEGVRGVRDVGLSLPVVVGRAGIPRLIEPEFSAEEDEAFRACARVVREGIRRSESDEHSGAVPL